MVIFGRHDWLGGRRDLNIAGLDHDVQSESTARQLLTISAVAAIDKDW